jgi:hypothetical protein
MNEEALDNFQRLVNFIEVKDVKEAYESAYLLVGHYLVRIRHVNHQGT